MARAFVKKGEPIYTMQFGRQEAITLFKVLRLVGGSPRDSHRRYADSLLEALRSVMECEDMDLSNGVVTKGSIDFVSKLSE